MLSSWQNVFISGDRKEASSGILIVWRDLQDFILVAWQNVRIVSQAILSIKLYD